MERQEEKRVSEGERAKKRKGISEMQEMQQNRPVERNSAEAQRALA